MKVTFNWKTQKKGVVDVERRVFAISVDLPLSNLCEGAHSWLPSGDTYAAPRPPRLWWHLGHWEIFVWVTNCREIFSVIGINFCSISWPDLMKVNKIWKCWPLKWTIIKVFHTLYSKFSEVIWYVYVRNRLEFKLASMENNCICCSHRIKYCCH